MELQLCLALPFNHNPTIKGDAGFDVKEMNMTRKDSSDNNFSKMKQKRGFAAAFEDSNEEVECKTLSLFIWNGQPNEEEDSDGDDHHGKKKRPFEACDGDFEEGNQLVGWPPIKSRRKKQFHFYQGDWIRNDRNNIVVGRKSMYVKVKMEGVAIGRKINLRFYDSYQVLTRNLVEMFAKYQNRDNNNSTGYKILYQDKEGDWMLAGDLPWQTFIETVQRIEILRKEK